MIVLQKSGRTATPRKPKWLSSAIKLSRRLTSQKGRKKEIPTKKAITMLLASKCSLTIQCPPSSVDPIYHPMDSFTCCRLGNGSGPLKATHNTVLFSSANISSKDQASILKQEENRRSVPGSVQICSRKATPRRVCSDSLTIWYLLSPLSTQCWSTALITSHQYVRWAITTSLQSLS